MDTPENEAVNRQESLPEAVSSATGPETARPDPDKTRVAVKYPPIIEEILRAVKVLASQSLRSEAVTNYFMPGEVSVEKFMECFPDIRDA
jgi:hypothetical protein